MMGVPISGLESGTGMMGVPISPFLFFPISLSLKRWRGDVWF